MEVVFTKPSSAVPIVYRWSSSFQKASTSTCAILMEILIVCCSTNFHGTNSWWSFTHCITDGLLQMSVVTKHLPLQMPHPLRMKSLGPYRYFLQREQWRLTDTLMNPMVLMTVLPLVLMMILPRLNDPETRKEMEQIQMPKMDTPELSEIMTSIFGGGSSSSGQGQCQSSQPKMRSRANKRKDKS